MTKTKEKEEAINLRKAGKTIGEISEILDVSKGSVSVWVRDIELDDTIKAEINNKASLRRNTKESRNKKSQAMKKAWDNGIGEKHRLSESERKERVNKYKPFKIAWQSNNRSTDNGKNKLKQYQKDYWLRLRKKVFDKLGGARCVNCGCTVLDILEVNHKNGGGRKELSEKGSKRMFLDILNNKVNINDYDIRCRVCNAMHYVQDIKGINGHKVIWKEVQKWPNVKLAENNFTHAPVVD